LIKPGFETELCMRFAHPLQGAVTPQQVMDALEGIHSSFEIIETRGDLTRHIALALADNAQQHSVILGPLMRPDASMRLDQVVARVMLNGNEIVVGTGEAVLGNPLNSLDIHLQLLDRKLRQLPVRITMPSSVLLRQV
jgi:2-keto-4-pentenoate hydratase